MMYLKLKNLFQYALILVLLVFFYNSLSASDHNNDGLSDIWQQYYGIAAGTGSADPDGDGYTNYVEDDWGTDPTDSDSSPALIEDMYIMVNQQYYPGHPSFMQIWIKQMVWWGMSGKRYQARYYQYGSWNSWGSAQNGQDNALVKSGDFVVNNYTSKPTNFDIQVSDLNSDGDAFTNWEEAVLGTSNSVANTDTDSDLLPDDWEMLFFSNTGYLSGTGDYDGDGRSDLFELFEGRVPDFADNTAGQDYIYVNNTIGQGDDINDGLAAFTIGSSGPMETVSGALDQAASGSIIIILPGEAGEYIEGILSDGGKELTIVPSGEVILRGQ